MDEYRIEEGAVATIDGVRVALAKIWVSKGKLTAWLSIVQKGSTEGQKDIDVEKGGSFKLGEKNFFLYEIIEGNDGKNGYVVIKAK